MKGIIMQINHSEAVVLSEDGSFSKIKNNKYTVGQTVFYKNNRKARIAAFISAAAAAVIITCGGIAYFTPTTYVSLDVNPSIAFSLNMFSRVLDAQPVNDDAKEILDELHLENKTIDDALIQTIGKLIEKGFITENETGDIIIATSESNESAAQNLAEHLEEKVQKTINDQGKIADVNAQAVLKDRVNKAKAMGVTPGKLNLVEKLKESAENQEEIDINEWLNKPVKEINKSIQENKNNKEKSTNSTTTSSNTNQIYNKKHEENQNDNSGKRGTAEQSNANEANETNENKAQETIANNKKSNESAGLGNANNNINHNVNRNDNKKEKTDDSDTITTTSKKDQSASNSKGNENSNSNKSNGKGK